MEEEKKCNCKPGECSCGDDCNCDENCSCGCNNPLIIEMEDDKGDKVKVEIVGTFDDNGKSYAIANDLTEENNSYILEVQSTDQGDVLLSIDDDAEFERLVKVVEKLLEGNTEE